MEPASGGGGGSPYRSPRVRARTYTVRSDYIAGTRCARRPPGAVQCTSACRPARVSHLFHGSLSHSRLACSTTTAVRSLQFISSVDNVCVVNFACRRTRPISRVKGTHCTLFTIIKHLKYYTV